MDEIDCILFPRSSRIHEGVVNFTTKADEADKFIVAICHEPWVLIPANLVVSTTVPGYEAVHDDLVLTGSDLRVVPAVQDGNIVTGQIPNLLPQFCDAVAEAVADLRTESSDAVPADE